MMENSKYTRRGIFYSIFPIMVVVIYNYVEGYFSLFSYWYWWVIFSFFSD
jgi:hypothetical protein